MSMLPRFKVEYLRKFIEYLFPPSKDAQMVARLSQKSIEEKALRRIIYGDIIALSDFIQPSIAALVREAKFHRSVPAQELLGYIFECYLKSHAPNHVCTLIPIPLSKERLRRRGYNQVSEIARCVPLQKYRMTLREDILRRTRDTKAQTTLSRNERLKNLKDAFGVVKSEAVRGAHILVLDDVCTTGATLHAARAALLPHFPASITLIALAH